ncbi:MAG: YwiC-like family protein [Chloroflexales bacterium]|nr:YwiC-like family protein [Chloroflexales bacterium]
MVAAAPQRLRTIALPAEHGSWGLTLEPMLLGLLVAPSWAGFGFAIGAFGLFLLRWPLKVAQTSWRQKRLTRMTLALRFVALYALLALGGLLAGVGQVGWRPLWPLLAAAPFGLIFYRYDTQNRSRSWQAELAGPVAFSATATVIALAAGWALAPALALWAVLVARAAPSILYVRARLRLDRGRPHQPAIVLSTHVVALAAVSWLIWLGWLPWLTLGVFVLLLVRAVGGLSRYRRPVPVKVIGFSELGWGLLTVLAVAWGNYFL